MSSPALEKVRSQALNLPESERAELAHNLVVSLDGPADPDVEKAWDAEILRRLAEIDSGTANLIDREEFRRRMQARINRLLCAPCVFTQRRPRKPRRQRRGTRKSDPDLERSSITQSMQRSIFSNRKLFL